MRVLHLISSGGMYGAEAVILNLSCTLNQMRGNGEAHRSSLGLFTSATQPNHELYAAAKGEGVDAFPVAVRGQMDASVPDSIRLLARRVKADVVHAHGYKADVYGFMAMRGTGTPIVSTCHNWLDENAFVRLYGLLDRRVLRRFDGVVAVSAAVRNRLLGSGVSASRVRLIANGVDLRRFSRTPRARHGKQPLRVGLVARLSREKGVDLFARAAAEVLKQLPETTFVVAGEGPEQPALEGLIVTLGIGHAFHLLGRTEDMPGFYDGLDLLVSASRTEGLPVALLEGMAASLPLVATAVGEVPRLIKAGTGVLVPPEDVTALAEAIADLLRNREQMQSYGQASRECIRERYSAERMVGEYLDLYRQVTLARSAGKGISTNASQGTA